MARCKLWDDEKDCQVEELVAFNAPHEVLNALIPEGREDEYCSLGENQQSYRQSAAEWGQRCGVDTALVQHLVCLALWGDNAPFGTNNNLFLLVLTFLSGIHRTRIWICAFTKRQLCRCGCLGRCTYDTVFDVLAWSFTALMLQRWPFVDHLSIPFPADSHRGKLARLGNPLRAMGCLLGNMGDWSWFKSTFGLRGWRGEGPLKQICWLCTASVAGRDSNIQDASCFC